GRMPGQPRVEEVDQRLERLALPCPVVRPDRAISAIEGQQAEEEVQAARRLPERIALYVEDDVARRGPRQALESAPRLAGKRMPVELAGGLADELQPGLVVKILERVRGHVGYRRRRRLGELRQRADARRPQTRDLPAPDPGHQRQVILLRPSLVAHLAELAQGTVVYRVGLGRVAAFERGEEAGVDAPVVGGEIGVAQRYP